MKRILFVLIMFLAFGSIVYGAADDMYVTSGAGGGGDGTTWAQAWNLAEFETDVEGSAEAGDRYFFKADATYTLASNIITALDGTAALPIEVIGVKSGTTAEPPTTADWAYGTDRPLITMTANNTNLNFDDYFIFRNFQVDHDQTNSLKADTGSLVVNCDINCSGVDMTSRALYLGGAGARAEGCEVQCADEVAIYVSGTGCRVTNTYIHDSNTAIDFTNVAHHKVQGCVVETVTLGIDLTDVACINNSVTGNTFQAATTMISGGTSYGNEVLNNIFDECTTPATWATEQKNNLFDWNSWDGDASSNVNITEGPHSIDSDITLNADFTAQSGSAVLDAGMQLGPNMGISGADFTVNIGADQDDNTAGGRSAGANLGGELQE